MICLRCAEHSTFGLYGGGGRAPAAILRLSPVGCYFVFYRTGFPKPKAVCATVLSWNGVGIRFSGRSVTSCHPSASHVFACLSVCLSVCLCLPAFSRVPYLRFCCWDSTQMALVLNRGLVDAHSNLGNLYKVRSCFAASAPELRRPMLALAGPCEGCQLLTMLCCVTLLVATAVTARIRNMVVFCSCCCHSARSLMPTPLTPV